jgi:putative nucleotidyltransferase with HDIG domain
MGAKPQDDKLKAFFTTICSSFVANIRVLSLYPPEHPETQAKISALLKALNNYLKQRPSITMLFINSEVVVENKPLPEFSKNLAKLIDRFEEMKLQRLVFKKGVTQEEVVHLFQVLVPLLKNPSDADLVLAKNQDRLPHILAGALPFDTDAKISYEELSSVLETARKSVLSFSGQLKDLFSDLEGPMDQEKVALSRETTDTIHRMIGTGEIPMKTLIYRRSPDPDFYVHAINVCALSIALARQIKLEEEQVANVGVGALLHDIGLHLSPSIEMSKTAAINLDEKKRQWDHPIRGAEILMASPGIPDVAPLVAYEHHIHFDGGGYPQQKSPRDLNLASMIVFIANAYDNLRRNRPEQKALSLTNTIDWMDRRLGSVFHPLLFKQFRILIKAQAAEEVRG